MTDLKDFSEQFEAWWLTKFSKEFLDSDNCWSAWTGWQARGELDAGKIKELEAKLDKAKETLKWIAKVNAMDSEYVRVARQALEELDK